MFISKVYHTIGESRFAAIARKLHDGKELVGRFVVVGASGFIINYLVLEICHNVFDINKITAEVVAMIVALQYTFAAHDQWTYRISGDASGHKHSLRSRYLGYLLTNSLGSLINIICFAAFSPYTSSFLALCASATISMIWNYCMNKMVVWRRLETKLEDKW